MTDHFTDSPQWKSGSNVADFLDELFRARGWEITNTTPYEERKLCLGDRHYRRNGQHLLIEYKSGVQTKYTGNVFLETISVDKEGHPEQKRIGWVYTCKADWIFYACVLNDKLLIFKPDGLRKVIETLKSLYRETHTKKQQNKDYVTWGVPMPLEDALRLADKVIDL